MAKFDSQTRVFPDYNESFEVYDRYTGGYVEPVGTYSLSSNVIFRISQQSGGPQDTSDNSHTVSYYEDSSPTDITVSSGGPYSVAGDTVATLSGRNQIRVNDASDLSFGNGTTNSPFTFSIWLKCDWSASSGGVSFPGNTLLFKSNEYWIYRELGGGSQNIHVRLYTAAGSIWSSARWSPSLADNEWINLTFTYDGTQNSTSLNLYVNGILVSRDASSASAQAMTAGAGDLSVGSYGNNSFGDFVGEISDIFLFDNELTAADALTLYNARFGAISTLYQSGFLNNPPRTILQVRDNATGSYPTVSRIGDPGRTGRYNTNFNDTNSVVFNSNVTTSYPSDLQLADAAYISQSIATPNTNATIEAVGIVRKGVADANITFTPGEDLTPFVEDNLFASTPEAFTDPFYLTGSTVANVGLGFTAPLRSKTKIELIFDGVGSTDFGEEQSAQVDNSTANYESYRNNPMVYYNFDLKRWEKVGPGHFMWSDVNNAPADYSNGLEMMWRDAMIGFGGTHRNIKIGYLEMLKNCGYPTDIYGFPYAPKFHATSSQTYSMSGLIDKPFLVEKFVLEYSASVNSVATTNNYLMDYSNTYGGFGPINEALHAGFTFFMMNQKTPTKFDVEKKVPAYNPSVGDEAFYLLTASVPTSRNLTWTGTPGSPGGTYSGLTYIDTSRDLITWGQHVLYSSSSLSDSIMTAQGHDPTEVFAAIRSKNQSTFIPWRASLATGGQWISSDSFVMSGNIVGPATAGEGVNYPQYVSAYPLGFLGSITSPASYEYGGRTGRPLDASGRDLVGTFGGTRPVTGAIDFEWGSGQFYPQQEFSKTANPYLLKPEDNIILGFQAPTYQGPNSALAATNRSGEIGDFMTLGSSFKLTLYGSLITDAHEHHDGLNQPLTSDAIHEFIGFHGPPLDQFDTEPRQQFSGSMLSNVMTGSISGVTQSVVFGDSAVKAFADPDPNGYTFRIAWKLGLGFTSFQDISPPARLKSFQRFSIAEQKDQVFFDSFGPDLYQTYLADGEFIDESPATPFVYGIIGAKGPGTAKQNDASNDVWPAAFPYEPRYSSINRQLGRANIRSFKSGSAGARQFQGFVYNIHPNSAVHDNLLPSVIQAAGNRLVAAYESTSTPIVNKSDQPNYNGSLNGDALRLLFFGIGDAKSGSVELKKTSHLSTSPHAQGATVRGFKYGMIHSLDMSPTCVFRRDKYGQFRDMLEQRPDTRFYSSKGGSSTISNSAVSVRFVASDGTSESPSKTSSSNLSQFATSSLPYFDGVARNRGPIVTADLGLTIVSI